MEFITEFNKEYEKSNIVYLECSKWGTNSDIYRGKAKYNKKSILVQINEKYSNNIYWLYYLKFDKSKEMYNTNNYANLDMSLLSFQKYYVKCLLLDNIANTFLECDVQFKRIFKNIKYILTDENISKIKTSILGTSKYSNIIELTKSLKLINKDLNIDVYQIKIEYINKKKENIIKEKNIIVIGTENMLSLLYKNNSIQFGIDATFKIIPKYFKKYKLITIYGTDKNNNIKKLACFICVWCMDSKSFN